MSRDGREGPRGAAGDRGAVASEGAIDLAVGSDPDELAAARTAPRVLATPGASPAAYTAPPGPRARTDTLIGRTVSRPIDPSRADSHDARAAAGPRRRRGRRSGRRRSRRVQQDSSPRGHSRDGPAAEAAVGRSVGRDGADLAGSVQPRGAGGRRSAPPSGAHDAAADRAEEHVGGGGVTDGARPPGRPAQQRDGSVVRSSAVKPAAHTVPSTTAAQAERDVGARAAVARHAAVAERRSKRPLAVIRATPGMCEPPADEDAVAAVERSPTCRPRAGPTTARRAWRSAGRGRRAPRRRPRARSGARSERPSCRRQRSVAARVARMVRTAISVPDRFCDIVMKGGIASGVVYPKAVEELAKTSRFKSVGGTSAGAIAAAATAAAEHDRDGGGFAELAKLPEFLGAGDNLSALFQPQEPLRGVYEACSRRRDAAVEARRQGAAALRRRGARRRAPGRADVARRCSDDRSLRARRGLRGGLRAGRRRARRRRVGRAAHVAGAAGAASTASARGCRPTVGREALTPWLTDLIDTLAGRARSTGRR